MRNNVKFTTKQTIHIVGFMWRGTFEEAATGAIHPIIQKMKKRMSIMKNIVHPNQLYGISYHDIPNGFTYYAAVEVKDTSEIPENMHIITIPEGVFASLHHSGSDIMKSYQLMEDAIIDHGYIPFKEPGMGEFDSLPIKIERYNLDEEDQSELEILIPITKDA